MAEAAAVASDVGDTQQAEAVPRAPYDGKAPLFSNPLFALLPNELIQSVFDHLDSDDCRRLSLTHRLFLPFTRARLLSRIVISSGPQIEAIINWCEATPTMRNLIREVHVTKINITRGAHQDLVTQTMLARLLNLVPHIVRLSLRKWSSSKVRTDVVRSLGRLSRLRTLHIEINGTVKPSTAIPYSRLLKALPRGYRLATLHMMSSYELAPLAVDWPEDLGVDQLIFTNSYSTPTATETTALLQRPTFSRIRALYLTTTFVDPTLLNALASNLEAMIVDSPLSQGCLAVTAPKLAVLAGFCCSGHIATASFPLLQHVKTVVAPQSLGFGHEIHAEGWDQLFPALKTIFILQDDRGDALARSFLQARPDGRVERVEPARWNLWTPSEVDLLSLLDHGRYERFHWY